MEHATKALDQTMGTRSRIQAKHSLEDARDAVHDANEILHLEMEKRDVILNNRPNLSTAPIPNPNLVLTKIVHI